MRYSGVERGKMVKSERIKLPELKTVIRSLKEDEAYKYLGILQADQINSRK